MRRSVVLVLLVLLGACGLRSVQEPEDVIPGETVRLTQRESAMVTTTLIKVEFIGATDSRCPSDVQCIQAGEAAIVVVFSGAGADRMDTLHLGPKPIFAVYGGYRFEAVALDPYPKSTGTSGDKVLSLRVTAAN